MLELIIKFLIALVMPISGFFVIKNLIDSEEKIYSVKNILIILQQVTMKMEYMPF